MNSTIIRILENLQKHQESFPDYNSAICLHVDYNIRHEPNSRNLSIKFDWAMGVACIGWEHFSCMKPYPIKHPDYPFNPLLGFRDSSKFSKLYVGEYGRRRMELVQRIIDVLKDDKDENNVNKAC